MTSLAPYAYLLIVALVMGGAVYVARLGASRQKAEDEADTIQVAATTVKTTQNMLAAQENATAAAAENALKNGDF